jgi:PKD repeat protein
MAKGFVNFAFALFAALLLIGSVFASGNSTGVDNRAPVITGVSGPTSLSTNQAGTWSVSATDPDGSYLIYYVNWGDTTDPSQADKASAIATATFQHTYSAAGTYTITITVSDSLGAYTQSTITTTVNGTNSLPDYAITGIGMDGTGNVANGQVVSISIPENTPTQINVGLKNNGASAQAASTVIFSFFGTSTQVAVPAIAAGQTASANSYVICTSSDTSTTVSVNVNQNQAMAESNYSNNQLSVAVPVICNHTVANQPPVISGVSGPVSLSANQAGTWKVSAYDPDGTYLTYSVNWGDGLDQAQAGQIRSGSTATFEHAYAAAGSYSITFTVTDAAGATTQSTAVVNVAGIPANQPPVITGVKSPVSLSVNEKGTWYISAYDPDGTYLSYSVMWGDEGETPVYKVETGSSATFQHSYAKAGTYTVIFTVKDAQGASVQNSANVVVGSSTGTVCEGYTKLYLGSEISKEGYYVRLSDVVGVKAQSAVYEILNSNHEIIGQVEISQGGSQTYRTTTGVALLISTCATYTGSGSNAEYAMTKVEALGTTSTNLPPVISGVSGPASLSTGKAGTWKVSAYDPDGTYLTYSVNWGEGSTQPVASDDAGRTGSSASFEHTYASAGKYTVTFIVTDSAGASTKSSVTVSVASGTTNGGIYASVGAVPTELYQYDSVYVTGKVSYAAGIQTMASGRPISEGGAQTFRVVLMLDNGNEIPKTASADGSVTASTTAASSGQGREEEITLYPGESREVSAYFTASRLGTNFAKIMVYQKAAECEVRNANGNSDKASGCRNYYTLVASDTTKIYVKESGIPSPPEEGVTIVLAKGWNQISVPASSLEVSKLAEKCDISTNVWYYNAASKQYEKATTLGGGHVGYWVKANAECKYTIETPYITPAPYAFNLKAGWNMIGAPLQATSVSSFAGNCRITSGPWNYAPSASQYTYSEKLEAGKGYWVKVASDCTMGSDANDMPPPVPAQDARQGSSVEPSQAVAPVAAVNTARSD